MYQTADVEKKCVQQITNTVTNLPVFPPLVIEEDVAPPEIPLIVICPPPFTKVSTAAITLW